MEKILFIINPKSGVDRVKALKDLIEKHLDKNTFAPEIAYTEYARHGTELARNAVKNGYRTVVAVGGDGSVNDIIAGIHGTDVTLCIVPKGSGNGLARTLQIPLDPAKAIALINTGKRIRIDLGKVNDRIFVSNVEVGFDALVAKNLPKANAGVWLYTAGSLPNTYGCIKSGNGR